MRPNKGPDGRERAL